VPTIAVSDIAMYYEELGEGEPLLLLHGGFGSIDDLWGSWNSLVLFFARHYRVIQIEHRGHGRTDNPAGGLTYAQIADDVAAFITAQNLAPVHVAGMSDGGIVALHLGMTRPELLRTITGVGVNYRNDDRVDAVNETFIHLDPDAIERDSPDWAADLARRHDRGKQPGAWKTLFRELAANLAVNPAYTEDDLRAIPTPTFLLAGEDDAYGNPEQMLAMKRAIPDVEIMIVNNAEHVVQATHPHIVGPAILDFLGRERPSPRP
jgi:pimeloyl-ACP methyl ester carboxylesterase